MKLIYLRNNDIERIRKMKLREKKKMKKMDM
jgi:hypothetical protein